MTKKEHYKMYKSGKNWVYASLATIALLTGATVVAEQHHGHSIAGISAKADDTDYNTRAAAAVNDATTTHDEVASVEDVTFNSPEEAVVGKWVNLTTVTGVAKDGDQSIDYKVNNVYVRKDQSTGKLIAAYVGGKTQITITPRGANNSVSVEIGKRSDTDGNVGTFSTIKRYSTDTDADGSKTDPNGAVVYVKDSLNNPLSFTLPSTFNATDDTLRVAYIPDTRAPHTAKTTSQAYPTPKIQMRTADALKTEIADALKQSDDSKAAKASAAAAIDNAKKEIENKINNDPTLDDTARDAQKKKAEETFKKAEEDIAKMDNKTDVDNRSNQAITDATNAYQPGESMDNQKTDATNALNAAVADEYNKVDSNNDLTQAEKDYLHDLIEADKKKLVQAITDAKDKNDLNAVNAQLIKGNDGLRPGFSDVKVTPAETVADRKTNAETVLNTAYSKAQNDINGNKTLSDAEKTERLTQLKEDYDKAKTAIQNATNAQTVVDALAQSQTDFANDNKDNDLAQRKSDLINDYKSREKVQERLDAIKNDDTLTDAEKISQTKQITDAVDAVSKNISAQETAQDAINAAAATKTKEQDDIIEGAHVPGKPLADQVTDAKNDIHKKADAAR
ncbi:KxYKxGKxW signal peptide domain-containing protein, partial [Fructobacillus durionis]